jgi:hypothetical protein
MKVGKWIFWNNGEKTEVNYKNSRIAGVKVTNNGKTEVVSN